MRDVEKNFTKNFSSFDQIEGEGTGRGMQDWAVPWADLMMVMFVLFVVLFIYANSHQDVKILFSQQSAEKAQAASSLDPLIGLIGQISSRVDGTGSQEIVRFAEKEVLYRSRTNGVSVVRESPSRIRVSLRGEIFFDAKGGELKSAAEQYMEEIAEVIRLSIGTVHVIGYADRSEFEGTKSFALSTARATDVADYLINTLAINPKRIVITGRGAYLPELPDTSQANEIMNRRVEIVITNEM